MDNPRQRFANAVRLRLEELGLIPQTYAEKLVKILLRSGARERGSEAAIIAYVYRVLAGERTVPNGAEEAWAEALGWDAGSGEYPEFVAMVEAARAWGKKDGQGHVARLEAENVALTARVASAEKALAISEAKRQALADRIAFLEAEESGGFQTGQSGL